MPAGIVELQDNDAIAAGAGLLREGGKQLGKELLVDPFERYQTVSPLAGATKPVT